MRKSHDRATLGFRDDYYSHLTDEDLLSITFTTGDPENLSGLVSDEPPLDQKPILEYAYDFRGTKRGKIRCVHCKYPNHLAGFVLKLPDSRRFLVGHDCGSKIYGVHFDGIKGDFDRARDRQVLLRRMQRLKEALPAFNHYLFKLRSHPYLLVYQQFRKEFNQEMPRLWGELEIACRILQGELHIERFVLDFDAEIRADERYDRELAEWHSMTLTRRKKNPRPLPPSKPIKKTVREFVGRLPTLTFFGPKCFSKRDIDSIAVQFESLASPPSPDTKSISFFAYRGKKDSKSSLRGIRTAIVCDDMTSTLRQANTLLDALDNQIERLREPTILFQPHILEMICNWANNHPKIEYKYAVTGNSLKQSGYEGISCIIGLPKTFELPDTKGIEEFRRAIN